MSRYREVSCTMAHATVWYAHATGEAPSSRCSAVGVGPESLGRGAAERSRREFGLSLAANLSTQGDTRSGGETDPPEVRRALSSRARLEGPDRLRLELPEA